MKRVLLFIWHLIKIAACVILIVGTFYYGYNYLNKLFRTPDANYGDSFHNMPKDSVDVLVLGSSHCQYSFSPTFFYEDTGLYSYVLGSAFQPMKVSYQMLREALKTQSPKVVLLEAYTATLDEEEVSDSRYVLAEYQMTGDEKYNTIDFLPEDKRDTYKNEFINNHNNWRTLDSLDDLFYVDKSIDVAFGYVENYVYLPVENYWYSNKYIEDLDVSLRDDDLKALNDIYDLCKENDISLLLYMVPMDNVSQMAQSLRNKVWTWADEHEVPYLDLLANDEKLDIRSAIHHDGYHAFINGASYISDYLADYISNNYNFDNHKDNPYLDDLYIKNGGYLGLEALRAEYNPYKYMQRIVSYPYTVVVKYSGTYENEHIRECLNKMGLNINEGERTFAIISNGEVVSCNNGYLEYELDDHTIRVDDYNIGFDENNFECNELLSFVVIDKNFEGSTKKVVDYLDGKPWEYGHDFYYN